jgi:predicted amidophosphoribosyltransferase
VQTLVGKCPYCGEDDCACHACRKQVQNDLTRFLNELERAMVTPDVIDETGIITTHMRSVWQYRDAVNSYFSNEKVEAPR